MDLCMQAAMKLESCKAEEQTLSLHILEAPRPDLKSFRPHYIIFHFDVISTELSLSELAWSLSPILLFILAGFVHFAH